jgi:hypothetical protein
MKCWTQKYASAEEAFLDVKLEGTFNSLSKRQRLMIFAVATIRKARISDCNVLFSHRTVLIPFLLAAVSLVPFVG